MTKTPIETDPEKLKSYTPKKGHWYGLDNTENATDGHGIIICYAVEDNYYVEVARAPNKTIAKAIMERIAELGPAIEKGHLARKGMN